MLQPKPNLQIIYVSDINQSTEFYKTLFNADPIFTSPRWVVFDAGKGASFALWTGGAKPDANAQRFSEIGILLPTDQDVDNLFLEWEKNPTITFSQKPQTEVFGRTFLVRDQDGNIIRVCSED